MSLSIRKSQVLSDGTIQIEITPNNKNKPYYYRVNKNNADAFIAESQKFDKQANQLKIGSLLFGIFAGTFGAHYFTKNMGNNMIKYLINSAAGISTALLMDSLSGELLTSKQKQLCNKFGVTNCENKK